HRAPGQLGALAQAAAVDLLIAQRAEQVGLQRAVAGLARGADAEPVGPRRRVMPTGVAGDPAGDLGALADDGDQRAARTRIVAALPVQPHDAAELPEHRA